MRSLSCPNKEGSLAQKTKSGNIIGHGFYKTKWESVVATKAGSAETHSARIPSHPTIDFNIVK